MHPLLLFLYATCFPVVWMMDQKALDEFVKLPDTHYEYTVQERKFAIPFEIVTTDTINMTSQKWLDESQVDKPVWSHELKIYAPRVLKYANSCLLMITAGQYNESPLSMRYHAMRGYITARDTDSIVATLRPLPIKPLTFYDHPLGLENITGYDIVAYSWWKFMNDPTAPPHWLVQFPMVKAVVRAIDTIVDFVKNTYSEDVTRFTLTGVSLGGWVSWLTAAVDKRVEAIVPIAMDFLNFTESFHHEYRSYCGWSYLLRPFYKMNITRNVDSPRFSDLVSHVDPLAYNERYTNVTKSILVLSGDELFPPDNSRHYFAQLEGINYLQIIPNIDYGYEGEHVFSKDIKSFYLRILKKDYLDPLSWEIKMTNTSATIKLYAPNTYRVYSYHADSVSGTRRDFRMRIADGNSTQKTPVKWIQTDLGQDVNERNVYTRELQIPEKGWGAFFIQVLFSTNELGAHFTATSDMVILPDTFPCPYCDGTLV